MCVCFQSWKMMLMSTATWRRSAPLGWKNCVSLRYFQQVWYSCFIQQHHNCHKLSEPLRYALFIGLSLVMLDILVLFVKATRTRMARLNIELQLKIFRLFDISFQLNRTKAAVTLKKKQLKTVRSIPYPKNTSTPPPQYIASITKW